MKKTQLFTISAVLTATLLISGCGGTTGEKPENIETTAPEETVEAETTEFNVTKDPSELSMYDDDFVFSDYLTLDGYDGINAEDYKLEKLDEASVLKLLDSTLAARGYYEDNPDATVISEGDVAVISFESTIDEEEYSGGSQSGFAVLVGIGEFAPEVEKALVGKAVGDSFEVSGTYPELYENENVANKTADFSITVEKICRLREFSDEIAAEISEDDTMTKDKFVEDLGNYYGAVSKIGLLNRLWDDISAKTVIIKLPVGDRLDYCLQIETYYRQYAEQNGATFEELLEQWEMTYDQFNAEIYNSLSEEVIKQDLILCAICAKEGFERRITDEEYQKQASLIATASGYSDVESLESVSTKLQLEKIVFLNSTMEKLATKLGILN